MYKCMNQVLKCPNTSLPHSFNWKYQHRFSNLCYPTRRYISTWKNAWNMSALLSLTLPTIGYLRLVSFLQPTPAQIKDIPCRKPPQPLFTQNNFSNSSMKILPTFWDRNPASRPLLAGTDWRAGSTANCSRLMWSSLTIEFIYILPRKCNV